MRGVVLSAESDQNLTFPTLPNPSEILRACGAILSVSIPSGSNGNLVFGPYNCDSGKFAATRAGRRALCSEVIHKALIGSLKGFDVRLEQQGSSYAIASHCLPEDLNYMIYCHSFEMRTDLQKLTRMVEKCEAIGRTSGEDGLSYDEQKLMSCLAALGQPRLCRLVFAEEAGLALLNWGLRRPTMAQNDAWRDLKTSRRLKPKMLEKLQGLGTEINSIFESYMRSPNEVINDFMTYQSLLQYMYMKMFRIILAPEDQNVVTVEQWLAASAEANRLHELSDRRSLADLILKDLQVNLWRVRVTQALRKPINAGIIAAAANGA